MALSNFIKNRNNYIAVCCILVASCATNAETVESEPAPPRSSPDPCELPYQLWLYQLTRDIGSDGISKESVKKISHITMGVHFLYWIATHSEIATSAPNKQIDKWFKEMAKLFTDETEMMKDPLLINGIYEENGEAFYLGTIPAINGDNEFLSTRQKYNDLIAKYQKFMEENVRQFKAEQEEIRRLKEEIKSKQQK